MLYRPVLSSDGIFSIHEIIKDKDGTLVSVSYEPVKLQATSAGELDHILRQVYRSLQRTKPITEDELDAMMYHTITSDSEELDETDDRVINLVDYFNGVR